jgi:hypothetical protein
MTDLSSIDLFVPVQISWIDSFSSPREWTGIEDFDFEEHTEKSKQMMSIGYIVHVDDDNVFFADSICPEEKIMYGCMSIPLVAVLDVKVMDTVNG